MPLPRSHATPRSVTPDRSTCSPSIGEAISEFTVISVIGQVVALSCVATGLSTGYTPAGTRYAFVIQKLSIGFALMVMRLRCFIQYVEVQPGTTSRAG